MAIAGASLTVPAAHAGSGPAFGTSNPDLASVTPTGQVAVGDSTPNRLRYCFDAQIGVAVQDSPTGIAPFDFLVQGNDGDRLAYDRIPDGAGGVRAVEAPNVDPQDPRCVIVGFDDRVDLASMASAGVDADVVRRAPALSRTQGNPPRTLPLAVGGAPGDSTDAPEVVSVETRPAVNEIDYVFDELLEPTCSAGRFVFYTEDATAGGRRAGQSCSVAGARVTVRFGLADQVFTARRIGADRDAASDLPTQSAASFDIARSVGNAVAGSDVPTNAPDLVAAERRGPTQVDFAFDEPVRAQDPSRFRLVHEDGRSLTGTDAALLDDGRTLRLTFPNSPGAAGGEYPLVTVDQGGAAGATQGEPATEGAAAIATSARRPGHTDGPDLIGTQLFPETDEVVFALDESLDESAVPAAGRFFLVDPDADLRFAGPGGRVQLVDGNVVVVRFDFDIDDRIAAGFRGASPGVGALLSDLATADPPESGGLRSNVGESLGVSGPGLGGGGTTPDDPPADTPTPTPTPPPPTPLGPQPSGLPAATPRIVPTVVARVSPARDLRAPFRFRTRGVVVPPAGVDPGAACASAGRVSVQVKLGKRTVSTRRARMRADCTFASRVTFAARSRVRQFRRTRLARLKFTARFLGNARMFPRSAPSRHARIKRVARRGR